MGLCGRAGGGVPPAQYGAGRPGMGAGTGAALGAGGGLLGGLALGEMMGHSGGMAAGKQRRPPRWSNCPWTAPFA